jgi:hypothetical protein
LCLFLVCIAVRTTMYIPIPDCPNYLDPEGVLSIAKTSPLTLCVSAWHIFVPHHPEMGRDFVALTCTPFTWCLQHPASPTPVQPCHRTHSSGLHLQLPPSGIQTRCFNLLRLDKTFLASATYPFRGKLPANIEIYYFCLYKENCNDVSAKTYQVLLKSVSLNIWHEFIFTIISYSYWELNKEREKQTISTAS